MADKDQIPNIEQRVEERRLEELRFKKMVDVARGKYVTLFKSVGNDSFGKLLDQDEEGLILDEPERGGIRNVSKRFVVDWNLYGVDFEDLYSRVKEKVAIVHSVGDKEETFIGKLRNYDKRHLFLEEKGKNKTKSILKRNVKDWYSAKDLGVIGKGGF